jgi:hypothetical protein
MLIGCWLALTPPPLTDSWWNKCMGLLGLLLFALAILLLTNKKAYPAFAGTVPVACSALLIRYGGIETSWIKRLLFSRPLVWVGKLSYSLYLWHWPFLAFLNILRPDLALVAWARALVLISSLIVAQITLICLENPIRFGSNSKIKFTIILFCLALIGGIGYNAYARNGMNFRKAAKISNALNKFDYSYKQGCEYITGKSLAEDWCLKQQNDVGIANVMVLGDSLSNGYGEVLRLIERESVPSLHVIQAGMGRCPLLSDYGPPACRDFTMRVQTYLVRHKAIKTVVLAADWGMYSGGIDYDYGKFLETPQSFRRAFIHTIQFYKSHGYRVIFFYATPTGGNPRACIARSGGIQPEGGCALPIARAIESENGYRDLLASVLKETDIASFDPHAVFCRDGWCQQVDEKLVLFYDSRHLSEAGAQFLVKHATPLIVQALIAPH